MMDVTEPPIGNTKALSSPSLPILLCNSTSLLLDLCLSHFHFLVILGPTKKAGHYLAKPSQSLPFAALANHIMSQTIHKLQMTWAWSSTIECSL
ncbi:unnamed protein product, partial [Vitis vinifera]